MSLTQGLRWSGEGHLEADLSVPSLLRLRRMGLVLDTLGGPTSTARELPMEGEGGSWVGVGGGGGVGGGAGSTYLLHRLLPLPLEGSPPPGAHHPVHHLCNWWLDLVSASETGLIVSESKFICLRL